MKEKAGSSHVFSELFAHANWHTKNDTPLLTPGILAPWVCRQIREYCAEAKGVHFKEVAARLTMSIWYFNSSPPLS